MCSRVVCAAAHARVYVAEREACREIQEILGFGPIPFKKTCFLHVVCAPCLSPGPRGEKLVLRQVPGTACITLHSLRSLSRALTHVAVVDPINRSFRVLTPHLQNELQLHRIKKVVDRLGPRGVCDLFLFAPLLQSLRNK